MSKSNTKKRNPWRNCRTLPADMLMHANFVALSADAVKLLVDILSQYRGHNNGDLCAAETTMRMRGWNNKRKLMNARGELEHYGFITITKQGGKLGPTLYALSFFAIDWCNGKHHEKPTDGPSDDWARLVEPYKRKYKNPPFKGVKNKNTGSPLQPGKPFLVHPYNQRIGK